MKKISRALIIFLMVFALSMLASCGKDKDKNKEKEDDIPKLPGINTEGGVETPIIPYE